MPLTPNIEFLLRHLFKVGVNAVKPWTLIMNNLKLTNGHLLIQNRSYELKNPVRVVGFGKAAAEMAAATEDVLGDWLQRGIVSIPEGSGQLAVAHSKIEYIEGAANNLPDENSLAASLKIKSLVSNSSEGDVIIVLISGGGSALLPLPKEGVTLGEKAHLIKRISDKGATIAEMNTVRKQLSQMKGGGLAKLCYPAKVISLIISDVIGDPLDIIASGPTCPNTTPASEAIDILKKYSIYDTLPARIRDILNESIADEFPQFEHVQNVIIGNNVLATEAILNECKNFSLQSLVLSTTISGDVNYVATLYSALADLLVSYLNKSKSKNDIIGDLIGWPEAVDWAEKLTTLRRLRNTCLVLSGEPTVVVNGNGKGGRNQHLVLSFCEHISNLALPSQVWILSCGTDGIDGPTDAAGAIGNTMIVNEASGYDITQYLNEYNSYNFFNEFMKGRYLVKVGHTGTNVMDIHLILILVE